MPRTRDCCRCNRGGRCRNCSCQKEGKVCSSCLPGRMGRCENRGSLVRGAVLGVHSAGTGPSVGAALALEEIADGPGTPYPEPPNPEPPNHEQPNLEPPNLVLPTRYHRTLNRPTRYHRTLNRQTTRNHRTVDHRTVDHRTQNYRVWNHRMMSDS